MSDKQGGSDALVDAISEFRQELVGWIDALVGAVRERHAGTAARSEEPAPTLPVIGRRSEDQQEGAPAPGLREMPRGSDRSAASQPSSNGDPGHRLDALARQLGARLRKPDGSRGRPDRAGGDDSPKDRNAPAG